MSKGRLGCVYTLRRIRREREREAKGRREKRIRIRLGICIEQDDIGARELDGLFLRALRRAQRHRALEREREGRELGFSELEREPDKSKSSTDTFLQRSPSAPLICSSPSIAARSLSAPR